MVARGGRRRPTSGLPRPPIEYEDKYHSARQTSDSVKPTPVFLLDGWRAYGCQEASSYLPRATRRSTSPSDGGVQMRPPARPHEAGPANLVTNPEPGSAQTKTAQPVGVVGLAARNLDAPEGI
ncbi:hypothetical protein G6F40_016255 [Rhizopus arrhizus]|nr:hypothetical protein G6F40_016255 [Rhizopus arrhizus]